MHTMSQVQMQNVDGGRFWDGMVCGAGIVLTLALATAPEPTSKTIVYATALGTVAACGAAFD